MVAGICCCAKREPVAFLFMAGFSSLMSLTCSEIAEAFPEYRFVKELGDGTFKVACLVEENGEQKVLKVSKASVEGPDANLPERLRREIEAMKQVDCENIAQVLEGPGVREIASEERVFYIERFYPGETLDKRLNSSWAAEDASALLRGLLTAVKALEDAGIVHRDIKPENIVFDEDGKPVLLDLGIAYYKDLSSITEPFASSPKTPRWAAPELFAVRSTVVIDSRTDLFGVGVVCFEAVTGGVHPFNPDEPEHYMERLNSGEIDTKALNDASVPEPLAGVLVRLLQGAPNRRFRKVDAALKASEAC
jgi:serine/threonine protein kinase